MSEEFEILTSLGLSGLFSVPLPKYGKRTFSPNLPLIASVMPILFSIRDEVLYSKAPSTLLLDYALEYRELNKETEKPSLLPYIYIPYPTMR